MKKLAFFLLTFIFGSVQAETLNIAIATNFTKPMKAIATAFEQDTGHRLIMSFGSSGKLFAQIKHGAPYKVFLSADTDKPQRLIEQNLAVADSRFTYAKGKIVLWSTQKNISPQEKLSDASLRHLAIANPKLAPYGQAAVEALKSLQLYQSLSPKLVQGENIGQTYQFIATGNAELGFIALSQVMEQGVIEQGSGWVVPDTMYQPIHQDAVLLNTGKEDPAAIALLNYLKSDKVAAIIHAYGYQ